MGEAGGPGSRARGIAVQGFLKRVGLEEVDIELVRGFGRD